MFCDKEFPRSSPNSFFGTFLLSLPLVPQNASRSQQKLSASTAAHGRCGSKPTAGPLISPNLLILNDRSVGGGLAFPLGVAHRRKGDASPVKAVPDSREASDASGSDLPARGGYGTSGVRPSQRHGGSSDRESSQGRRQHPASQAGAG